jgi:AraC-like DNA-binding protein
MVWGGVEVRPREMVFHSLGDRIHQRSAGPCRWGLIALSPMHLASYSRMLAHEELNPPRATVFLRPHLPFGRDLRRLHAEACHLAETKPDTIAHKEVARALEQHVLYALINCMTARALGPDGSKRQHYAETMARFEDVLASHCEQHLPIPGVCEAVGVGERTLRIYCAQTLHLSPLNYERLRRMNLVRTALRRADPTSITVADVARRHGFSELGRFAVAYRTVFGETPSTTLRGQSTKGNSIYEAEFA